MKDDFEWYIVFGIIIAVAFMLFSENFNEKDKDAISYMTMTIPSTEESEDPFTVKFIDDIDIRDTVYYQDLDINKQYIVKGWVEDEHTKETVGCSEIIFCPEKTDGYIDVVVTMKNIYIGQTLKFCTSIEEKK